MCKIIEPKDRRLGELEAECKALRYECEKQREEIKRLEDGFKAVLAIASLVERR